MSPLAAALALALLVAVPPAAQKAKDQADALKKTGDVTGAEAAYQKAIGLYPSFALAHNDYGSLLFENGRVADAIAQFDAATKTDPAYAVAWFNLGFAARKTGAFTQAVGAYRTYTSLKPEDTDGWYGLGEACRNALQRDCAVEGYRAYLEREKRPSEQKWIDKAKGYLAELQPAAAPQPTPAPASSGRVDPGPSGTAVAPAPAPVATTPAPAAAAPPVSFPAASTSAAAAKIAQGDGLFAAKQYREALFAFQDAVNADPSNAEALFALGKTYAVMGYYQQAIDRWQRVAELATDPGVRQRAQENVKRAQDRLAQAASPPAAPTNLAPAPAAASAPPGPTPAPAAANLSRSRYEEGVALINQRQYQAAADALTAALAANPSSAQAMAARGSARVGLRQYPEAVEDYQGALRLDPNMATPLFGAAEAFRAMGRKQDASLYYQRYVDSRGADVSPQLQTEAQRRIQELSH
jgi:tetratricopeptide (TPR) repeat protein